MREGKGENESLPDGKSDGERERERKRKRQKMKDRGSDGRESCAKERQGKDGKCRQDGQGTVGVMPMQKKDKHVLHVN